MVSKLCVRLNNVDISTYDSILPIYVEILQYVRHFIGHWQAYQYLVQSGKHSPGRDREISIQIYFLLVRWPFASSRKTSTSTLLTTPKSLTVWITTNWNILKEMGIVDHRSYILRNMYAGQKEREFQKTSISALLTTPKSSTVWITINCGKFWKR